MKRKKTAGQTSIRTARRLWTNLSREALIRLREIATQHDFSVGAGDLIYLNSGWYVTHTGLIGLARRKRCSGIHVEAVDSLCDSGQIASSSRQRSSRPRVRRVSSATAMPIRPMFPRSSAAPKCGSPRLVPSTVPCARPTASASARSRKSERFRIRLRSFLRKTQMGTGMALAPRSATVCARSSASTSSTPNWSRPMPSTSAAPRRSERPAREQVENFVQQLADWAEKDRNALLCQLNSYTQPKQEGVA